MTDDLTHYMDATDRMRQRAEQAEAERDLLRARHVDLVQTILALEAERDHLQDDLAQVAMAVVGDRTGVIEQDEIVELVRGVVNERDELRASVASTTAAANSAAGAVEAMALKVTALTAEQDRLRAVIGDGDGPIAKTMEYLGRVEAERDRLRAVVMAVRECDNCPACQRLAIAALDGTEATDG